jgi:Arc/MetJ family transcription regulator
LKQASCDAIFDARRQIMRTTIVLDDELLAEAEEYTGITERAALVREALRALIQREAIKRLVSLGGSDPNAEAAPRRRYSFE